MRIAIIYPVTHGENVQVIRITREPLGACYISSALISAGHETRVYHPIGVSDDQLIRSIRNYKPDCAMFSTLTYNFNQGITLAQRIKKEYRDIPIVFGGDHVTGCVNSYGRFPHHLKEMFSKGADFVVYGEGAAESLYILKILHT